MSGIARLLLLGAFGLFAGRLAAQVPETGAPVQTAFEALAQDAQVYAARYDVPPVEAISRLSLLQDSVAATTTLAESYRARLAGLYVEHAPALRFTVLLTGDDLPPDTSVTVDGIAIPVVFRGGAPATRDDLLAAIAAHQAELRAALPHPPALAPDPRTGRLLILLREEDAGDEEPAAREARLAGIAGVPVKITTPAGLMRDAADVHGARLIGAAVDGHRGVCSAGFVVTDGARTGITTAAHCPDDLTLIGPTGARTPLTMVGAWGAGTQDVQIHVGPAPMPPVFAADAAGTIERPLATWRTRAGTRAGDFVCHQGERSGYACAEVELPDFAPPGDLCAGPCPATWVAVGGPDCGHGDSGGPVFAGTVAFGIVKGASTDADGTCRLYFYMSVDYLPAGWTLLHR